MYKAYNLYLQHPSLSGLLGTQALLKNLRKFYTDDPSPFKKLMTFVPAVFCISV